MCSCKPVNSPVALESIIKHADVGRYMQPGLMSAEPGCGYPKWVAHATRLRPFAAGLDLLRRLRVTWGDWKRARRNAHEEAPHAARVEAKYGPGAAYDAGLSMGIPPKPDAAYQVRRVQEALDAGLPKELAELCRRWLKQQV